MLPDDRVAVILISPLGTGPEQLIAETFSPGGVVLGPYLSWTPDNRSLIVAGKEEAREPPSLFLLSTIGMVTVARRRDEFGVE
jgi:hypothetical protein